MSKKVLLVIGLIALTIVAFPLSILLFPWAQSVSATEMADGTKALLTIDAGTWITKFGMLVSSLSLLSAIWVGIFYNPKNK